MHTWRTLDLLFYLIIFISYYKLTQTASIDTSSPATSASIRDILTNIEKSIMTQSGGVSNSSGSKLKRTLEDCNNSFSWMCLKLKFTTLLEYLTEREEFRLLNGVTIMKDPRVKEIKATELVAEIARSYPNDSNARLNGYIINKVNNFLQTHYLRFKLIDDNTIEEACSLIETGRKDKFDKKGGIEALIAAGLMMKGTLMTIGVSTIALIAGKALITSLMALTLAVVGLKSQSVGGKTHTYEIVTKPIYTSSHTHSLSHDDIGHGVHSGSGYGSYARSLNLNLPKSLRGNKNN